MEQDISPETREKLKKMLEKATPYTPSDPEYDQFDGNTDEDRANATLAKIVLDKYPE